METELLRDYAMYAAIFGFFGFSWFGWAQENPPESWRVRLGIASGLSLLVAAIGGYLAVTHWGSSTALSSDAVYIRFGIIVGIEVLACLAGALVLVAKKRQHDVARWIALVVGAHFFPLASVFQDAGLTVLGMLLILAAILPSYVTIRSVQPNTATCVLAGIVAFVFAVRGLLLFWV